MSSADPGTKDILIVDNDRDIAETVRAALQDEGYRVSVIAELSPDAIARAVGSLEPDAVLLDGESPIAGYGSSWLEAAKLADRSRPVPVIMFTAHAADLAEARAAASRRVATARFAAVLAKPFNLDELLDAVHQATGRAISFERSASADQTRSAALAKELESIGAEDVRPSARREWVTFRTPGGRLMQIYWWQTGGSYLIGRYDLDGRRMDNIALLYDRGAAVQTCAAVMESERNTET